MLHPRVMLHPSDFLESPYAPIFHYAADSDLATDFTLSPYRLSVLSLLFRSPCRFLQQIVQNSRRVAKCKTFETFPQPGPIKGLRLSKLPPKATLKTAAAPDFWTTG